MKATDSSAKITIQCLQMHLLSYESHVSPKIRDLELLRFTDIPKTLAQRKENGEAFLEKGEVTSLVEWKLKHGTYRPNLAKLVASNSVEDIRETTKPAFTTYQLDNDDYSTSITALTKLKGIGPATASLLLSTYDPVKVPFFSDELYRYLNFEAAASKGWDRKINYTMKEYKSLFAELQTLRARLEKESKQTVSATDIEKMAYVLGKEATSLMKYSSDEENATDDEVQRLPAPKRRKKNSGEINREEPTSNPPKKVTRKKKASAKV